MTIKDRTKTIKNIQSDLDDLEYIKRNYDLDNLSDIELYDLYCHVSRAWLILSKVL